MSIQHFQTKLGITKYSIVTNSNDSVTLRLMTEHDLAMLYEWLNRSIVEWWGEKKHARHLLTYRNSTCQAFFSARVRHSIHCNVEWRADWVCPVVRCSWKRGRMVGRRNRSRAARIDHWRMHHNWAKAWEPSWFELWLSCCSMIPRSPRSKRPVAEQLRAIRCYEKAGLERQGTVTTQMVQPCTWFKHARHSSEHAVLPNPSIEGDCPRAGALGRPRVKR